MKESMLVGTKIKMENKKLKNKRKHIGRMGNKIKRKSIFRIKRIEI